MDAAANLPEQASKPNRLWFLLISIAIVCLPSILSIAWLLGPGFGESHIPRTVMFAVTTTLMLAFGLDMVFHRRLGGSVAMPLLVLLLAPAISLAPLTKPIQDARLSSNIQSTLAAAEKNLSATPPIAKELLPLLSSRALVSEHRAYLQTLEDSNASPQVVDAFLFNSEKFGVDASFVMANGFIRPEDRANLEDRIKAQAAQGNKDAKRWVRANLQG